MTNKENFRATPPSPVVMEALGRWLCWQFFCNQSELLKAFPALREVFENACTVIPAWTELLSGAYRSGTGEKLLGVKRRSPKWTRLGEVVYPGSLSIDGVGEVREKEVLLYRIVAEGFMKNLATPGNIAPLCACRDKWE